MEDNLQFDKAEFDAPSVSICATCSQPLSGSYFQAGGRSVCGACAEKIRQHFENAGSGLGPVLTALLLGTGAAILGGGVYGAIMGAGWQLSIVSIGIGIFVGKAVRKGSGGVGGVFYQWLAAILTYAGIAGGYACFVFYKLPSHDIATILGLALIAYRLPFLGGTENAIGLFIIAIGVWQAWRLNRGVTLEVTGPHPINPPKSVASA